jgi:hypothetical protein
MCGHAQAGMKRVYELDIYRPAETLSDVIWHDFDKWSKIECVHQQNKRMKAKSPISIFCFLPFSA